MTNKGRIGRQVCLSLYHRTPKQDKQLFSLWSSLAHFSLLTKLAMLFLLPGVWEATSPIATENSYSTQAVTTWTPGRYHPVQTDENLSHFHSCWDNSTNIQLATERREVYLVLGKQKGGYNQSLGESCCKEAQLEEMDLQTHLYRIQSQGHTLNRPTRVA